MSNDQVSFETSRAMMAAAHHPARDLAPEFPLPLAEVLSAHTAPLFAAAVHRAAGILRRGELVGMPTETVYGLAANAFDALAVARIFETKGRPAHNPIIVHVADLEMARRCVAGWPPVAEALAREFWPGPLTLVLSRSSEIPDIVTAGGNTVGIRWPSHPLMQAVIRECGFPLAAPSANPANCVSPTNAGHVRKSLGHKISLILDGGQSQVGIESTVLDLTSNPPRVLRPGMIGEAAIRAVIEKCRGGLTTTAADSQAHDKPTGALRSPGQLPRHYSPRARLIIRSWSNEPDLRTQISDFAAPESKTHIIAHTVIPSGETWGRVSVIPHDAEAFARAIYAELHCGDELDAELIVVEELPAGVEWQAIADRLKRAATRDLTNEKESSKL